MKRGRAPFAVALGALVLLGACGPSPLPDGERRQALGVIGRDVAVPTLVQLSERVDELEAASVALASEPTEANLEAARDAWREARDPWTRNLIFGFGPVTDDRLDAAIDQPVDVNRIQEVLDGDAAIDLSAVVALGANKKGFHTLEFLLFVDPEGTTALTSLAADDVPGDRRRDYVSGVAGALAESVHALEDAWSPPDRSSQGYIDRLTRPGAKDSAFDSVQSALDAIVNQTVFLAELVTNARLGKPLGNESGGEPRPELEESPWADASVSDMQGALTGIRNAYFGTLTGKPGRGLSALVAARSPGADRRVQSSLNDALEKVSAIPRPYRIAVTEERDAVQAAYEAVRALRRNLATEVVGVLGATLKFNDNDGD
jgi:putative iron-regulated protein